MIALRFPAHVLAAGACIGLALADLVRVHDAALAGSVVTGAALVLAEVPLTRLLLAAVLICVCAWWWGSVRLDRLDASRLEPLVGRAGRATVVVTAPASVGQYRIRVPARTRRFAGSSISEPVLLELAPGRSPPQGAVLDALVVVAEPRGPTHGFDERTWLRRHGVHVVLRVDRWQIVGHRGGLGGIADRIRARLARSIAPGLSGGRRAVLEGIVLGDTAALTPRTRQEFQASGLYHLLAVSGQNVVLVAAGVLGVAWLLGLSRVVGELGALAAIGAYVLAVGPQPSVVRAGVSGAVASLAWLTGRMRDAWYVLLLGAIVLLGWNPYLVYDAGFQLSFAAVAAIFLLAPRIHRRLEGYPLPRGVRGGIAVSGACGLVTAPILILQFHYLPLLGVLANLLAEPAMPLLLTLAFATAAIDAASPSAAAVLAWFDGIVAAYIALCARVVAAIPFAEIQSARAFAAAGGTLLIAAYAWRRWRTSSSLPI
ncbi:MAG: ComEC/Rec2 family competence protein [Actinobacteria bacterium]|nr:ComEC/Rec2 family competence protein [Actinomycetota bacterium]